MSIDELQQKIRALKNPSMISLDPTEATVPHFLMEQAAAEVSNKTTVIANAYEIYCISVLEALAGIVPAVKLNPACFEFLGFEGTMLLERLLRRASELGFYVLLDGAYSDVAHIAEIRAKGLFCGLRDSEQPQRPFQCDAVTLNGYLGSDSIKPYLPYCNGGDNSIFVIARSSNKSASEIQDLLTGARLTHIAMMDLIMRWTEEKYGRFGYSNVGCVVTLTKPEMLKTLREKYNRLFFLVVGYGAQGGANSNIDRAFDKLGYGAVICAGRTVLGAWKKQEDDVQNYVQYIKEAALKMKKDIGKYVTVV